MANENDADNVDRTLEDSITRYMEAFSLPLFGDSKMLNSLMLKNLLRNDPDLDLSAIRIARELGYTHTLLLEAADEYLRPAGLSWSRLFILLWLRAMQEEGKQGLYPSELSCQLAVTRNTISTLLGGLERQGYITRELDPGDKRRLVIRLTPAGYEAAQKSSGPLFRQLQTLLSSLDHEQRVELVRGLMQLQQTIIEHQPELAARTYPPFRTGED